MAANDNLQPQQFGGDAYKQQRMAILYERSIRNTPISAVANAQNQKP